MHQIQSVIFHQGKILVFLTNLQTLQQLIKTLLKVAPQLLHASAYPYAIIDLDRKVLISEQHLLNDPDIVPPLASFKRILL